MVLYISGLQKSLGLLTRAQVSSQENGDGNSPGAPQEVPGPAEEPFCDAQGKKLRLKKAFVAED